MLLKEDPEQTTEETKTEVADDEAEVTEQAAEEEAKAGEEEAEDGGDSEDDGAEELTVRCECQSLGFVGVETVLRTRLQLRAR